MAGSFVSFEGIDGCGKSTQLELLATLLESAGARVVRVREPGGTELGEAVRGLLLDPAHDTMSPRAEALLYSASRAQLIDEVIRPAISDGAVVLADRFVDSTRAYQGAGRELGTEAVGDVSRFTTGGLLPDVTIYCELDAAAAAARRAAGGDAPDRLEQEQTAFFERAAAEFAAIAAAEPDRVLRVDARPPADEIHTAVVALLAAHPATRELPGLPSATTTGGPA